MDKYYKKYLKYKNKYFNLKGGVDPFFFNCRKVNDFMQGGGICFMHASLVVMFFDDNNKSVIFNQLLNYNKSDKELGINRFQLSGNKIKDITFSIILEFIIQNINKLILNPSRFTPSKITSCSLASEDFNKLIRSYGINFGSDVDTSLLERKGHTSSQKKEGGFPYEFSLFFVNHFKLPISVRPYFSIKNLKDIPMSSGVISRKGHACAIIKCFGLYYFYDSNLRPNRLIRTLNLKPTTLADFFYDISDDIFEDSIYHNNEYFKIHKLIDKKDIFELFKILNTTDKINLLAIIISNIKEFDLTRILTKFYLDAFNLTSGSIDIKDLNKASILFLLLKIFVIEGFIKDFKYFSSNLPNLEGFRLKTNLIIDGYSEILIKFMNNEIKLDEIINEINILEGSSDTSFSYSTPYSYYTEVKEESNDFYLYLDYIKENIVLDETILLTILEQFRDSLPSKSDQVSFFESVFKKFVSISSMKEDITLPENTKSVDQKYFEDLIPESHKEIFEEIKSKFPDIFTKLY